MTAKVGTTTLPGKKKTKRPSREATQQLLKALVTTLCTIVLLWQLSKCLSRYLQYETTAILSVKKTGETTFLAFTVCPAFHHAYKDDILRQYGTSRKVYQRGNYTVNETAKSAEEIFEEVTWELSDILKKVYVKTMDDDQPKVVIPVDESLDVWMVKFHPLYGKCFSLVLGQNVTRLGVRRVDFTLNSTVYVYLHHPGQFWDYNSKAKVQGLITETIFIDVAYELTINTRDNDKGLSCSAEQDFEFDNCVQAKGPRQIFESNGCTLPFIPNPYPKCNPRDAATLRKTLQEFAILGQQGETSLCQRPCTFIEVFLGLSETTGDFYHDDEECDHVHDGHLSIYLKSTTKISKVVLDYPILTAVAEVGGYTGLLLGVSIVDIAGMLNRVAKGCY